MIEIEISNIRKALKQAGKVSKKIIVSKDSTESPGFYQLYQKSRKMPKNHIVLTLKYKVNEYM